MRIADNFFDIESRIPLESLTDTPICGKEFSAMLFRDNEILTALGFPKDCVPGENACDALGIRPEDRTLLGHYLTLPTTDAFAVLSASHRVVLLSPFHGEVTGGVLAIVLHTGERSVARVLTHSFPKQVCMSPTLAILAREQLRAEDENTFLMLNALLARFKLMTGGREGGSTWVRTRAQLSHLICAKMAAILRFFGEEGLAEQVTRTEFTYPLPYEGEVPSDFLTFSLFLLISGVLRCYPEEVASGCRWALDEEELFPMAVFPLGNRKALPTEWRECMEIAGHEDFCIDFHRRGGELFLRYCPMRQQAKDAKYALRAQLPDLFDSGALWGPPGREER